ncbi:Transcription factor EC [Trichinella pseudospiralis]|uniref:Transcription factor EC n=1 Tax=Trichinella pseudospiralis TaxID=6337 RepID=A0A0V1FR63_TRIPS|nr:Transcription factor EC [Trichinella pseudospiralis]
MKLNKGSILKASVDYIRQLRKDQERLYQLLQKQMALEAENKRLSNRNQDLEEQMRLHGLLPGIDTAGLGSRSTFVGKQMKLENSLEGDYPFNVSPTSRFTTCAEYSSSSVLAGRGAGGGQHSFLDRSSPCFRTTAPLSPDSAGSSDCAYTGLPLLHEQALFSAGGGSGGGGGGGGGGGSMQQQTAVTAAAHSTISRTDSNPLQELSIDISSSDSFNVPVRRNHHHHHHHHSRHSPPHFSTSAVDPLLLSESRLSGSGSKISSSPDVQWDSSTFSPEPQEQMDFSAVV